MKILIVDDDRIKSNDIRECLLSIMPDSEAPTDIQIVNTYIEAIRRIKYYKYDWVILDLKFPFREGQSIEPDAGNLFLRVLSTLGKKVNVIICSSDDEITEGWNYKEYDDIKNVKGYIKYDPLICLKNSFSDIITQIEIKS